MSHTSHVLAAGTPAPEFALHTTPDQVVSLSEFRGRPVILAFYPADWSPVCGDQMALYNELLDEFVRIRCRAAWDIRRRRVVPRRVRPRAQAALSLDGGFRAEGGVARLYGAYREQDGTSERALFVIDPEGVIRWSYCSPVGVNPGADGILRALESLKAESARG
jgi:peroxiredoxin